MSRNEVCEVKSALTRQVCLQRNPPKQAALALLLMFIVAHGGPAEAQFRADERLRRPRVSVGGEVCLLHGEAGDKRLVWRPDGTIAAVAVEQAMETEARFVPLEGEEIGRRLLEEKRLDGFQVTSSNHFVFVHNTTPQFLAVTTRILESMIPGMALHVRAMKLPLHEPPTPLVVVMLRTQQQYQAFQQIPAGVTAYYEPHSNRVVMCEEPAPGLPPEHALQQQLSTIAHEGAHQILHNIGVQQRLSWWPAWLTEGLAEYFAPTTVGKRLTWKGAGQVNDWRMYELERFLKSGAEEGRLVDDTVLAERLTSTGYATAWALTHFLARNRRESFQALVRECSQLRPLAGGEDARQGVVPSQREQFARHFGDDFAELERQIVAHLRRLPYQDPLAQWPHFAALAQGAGPSDRSADIFHAQADAERWCRRQQAAGDGVRTVVQRFPNRAAAEAYAKRFLAQ